MNLDIVKTELDPEDELPKFSNTSSFLEYSFNKELRIILERCDNIQNNIQRPVVTIKREKNFRCSIGECKKSYKTIDLLGQHIKRLHHTASIKCPYEGCDFSTTPENMKYDIRKIHNCSFAKHEEPFHQKYTCDNCGKNFAKLESHLAKCKTEKGFHCKVENCHSSFKLSGELRAHVAVVHADPVKCPYEGCNKLAKPVLIARHVKFFHERHEDNLCKLCGKWFYNIRQHEEICKNNGAKTVFCEIENCNKSFTTRTNLHTHLRGAHDTSRIKCPHKNCPKFIKRQALVTHLKRCHDDIRPSRTCPNCGKAFKGLEKHLKRCREIVKNELY